ncbi:MAG: acylphosphatase [Verrucomicrobia bacterium]|nr:acylphosphatase [Verrucomicrobiota bacterium]
MKKRMRLIISGRVQGVCYRAYARETAEDLGLTGWVRNLHNGKVEAVAEGEEPALGAFAAWCRRGPHNARVSDVREDHSEATGEFSGFEVVY